MPAALLGELAAPAGRRALVRAAAKGVRDRVCEWYGTLPADYFDNLERHPAHAARQWRNPLRSAWHAAPTPEGFDLLFSHPRGDGTCWGLRLQHLGGVIRPVRARALAIPIAEDARGLAPALYPERLFCLKRNKSPNPAHAGTLVWRDDHGSLHAAYALRKKAVVKPLLVRRGHPALPTAEMLAAWVAEEIANRSD